jgi:transposase InsO family protein
VEENSSSAGMCDSGRWARADHEATEFTEAQIALILRQAEQGTAVGEVWRKAEILRAECLNGHWLMSLDDARRKCEAWREDCNEERPHSSIGNKVPIEGVNRSAALGPP